MDFFFFLDEKKPQRNREFGSESFIIMTATRIHQKPKEDEEECKKNT